MPRATSRAGPLHLSGIIAWLAWLMIHVFFLIGFRNRLMVMLEWAWAYVTYDRSARLIVGHTQAAGEEPPRP
jgi:NADH dehydrogenase